MSRKKQKPLKAKITADHSFFDIITEAYRVFAHYKPVDIGVCEGCCMYREIEADFFNPNIKELPLHYIRDWYFAAYDPETGVPKSTWGYLLPRVLEILALGEEVSSNGIEVSLNRFQTGDSKNWTAGEWQVLDNFQRLFIKREIEGDTENYLDDAVCMFGLGGWSLDELFEQVLSYDAEVLAQKFWKDWCEGVRPGRESIWITAFWEDAGEAAALNFYTSEALRNKMETLAFADGVDPEIAAKALAVTEVIEQSSV